MSIRKDMITYFSDYGNVNLNNILINFEFIERSKFEITPQTEPLLNELREIFKSDRINKVDLEQCVKILNLLPSAYMFYFLHILGDSNSEYQQKLIAKTEIMHKKNEAFRRFYQRNMMFERMQMISRIFSEERIDQLISSIG